MEEKEMIEENDEEIISFQELIDSVLDRIDSVSKKLELMNKDIGFLKEKTDQIGLKLYWVNKGMDELLGKKGGVN